eukprot:gb/GEZJ01005332.1/.p1 GENE.gb/GEZJ01005332.1/~~gb/GEZJ01005332.1/.p1  ORF type:complete len:278 (+),score=25.28 gb/GEZJ01005332.1/:239-1072(+)
MKAHSLSYPSSRERDSNTRRVFPHLGLLYIFSPDLERKNLTGIEDLKIRSRLLRIFIATLHLLFETFDLVKLVFRSGGFTLYSMSQPAPTSRKGSAPAAGSTARAELRSRKSAPEELIADQTDIEARGAPSAAYEPQLVALAVPQPMVERQSAVIQIIESAENQNVDSRLHIANIAHISLLQEVTELCRIVGDAHIRDVSGEFRVLRRDVNSILECLSVPGTFKKEYADHVEDVRANTQRLRGPLDTLEATIRLDEKDAAKADEIAESVHSCWIGKC